MALLKKCDRCKKEIGEENEIGVKTNIYRLIPDEAYIRPSQKLLKAAKEENASLEYFPVRFKEFFFGEIDLCGACFDVFMKLP